MTIKLTQTGKHKLELIKLVRLFTNLGLIESKNIVDNAPSTFKVSKPELEFEQIKKNFEAIGAKVEKVAPIKKPSTPKPGEDVKENIVKPKSHSKAYTQKKDKRVLTKSKTQRAHDEKWTKLKHTIYPEKSVDDLVFSKKIQLALFIAIAGAIVGVGTSLYLRVPYIVSLGIIGMAIAVALKEISPKKPKDAGILAAAFTLFAHIISPVFYDTFSLITFGELWYWSSSKLFLRYFDIVSPSVFIPLSSAFVIAYWYNQRKNKTTNNNSTFDDKHHKKAPKSLRRKNRKLD